MNNIIKIFISISIVLIMFACVNKKKVTFTAFEASKVDIQKVDRIVILEIKAESEEEDIGKELSNLIRRKINDEKEFFNVDVEILSEDVVEKKLGKTTLDIYLEDDKDSLNKIAQMFDADLLIYGWIKYNSETHPGFVTKTINDAFSERPMRRTYREDITSINYELKLGIYDANANKIVSKRNKKDSLSREGKKSLLMFYDIFEPVIEEFLSDIYGKKTLEHRFLIK